MRNRLFMTGLAILAAVALTMLSGCARMANKSVGAPTGEWIPVQEAGLEEPSTVVDQIPVFGDSGGFREFRHYVAMNVMYTEEAFIKGIAGIVKGEFIIEKDGSIKYVRILESPAQILSDEFIKTMTSSPKWQPGMREGKPVRTKHTLSVTFGLVK